MNEPMYGMHSASDTGDGVLGTYGTRRSPLLFRVWGHARYLAWVQHIGHASKELRRHGNLQCN